MAPVMTLSIFVSVPSTYETVAVGKYLVLLETIFGPYKTMFIKGNNVIRTEST